MLLKNLISICAVSLFVFAANAQSVNVKDIPVDGDTESQTLISVKKGQKLTGNKFEIVEGHEDIEGEVQILKTEARKSWAAACEKWKKDTKEINKDNQVLQLSCNTAQCANAENNGTVCKSKATYKLKVKME